MKVITATGFYGTGSSAIIDLLSEYDNVYSKGDFEIRIAFDPYGISDLEFNLIENPNRNNSSNAVKKFMFIIKHLHGSYFRRNYENYFNGKFLEISQQYIKDLIEFEYFGKWHYDLIERGELVFIINRSYNKIFSIIKKLLRIQNEGNHSLLPKDERAYATIMDKSIFLKATRQYFNRLFEEVNIEKKEYLVIDQLVQSTNIARYERYFDYIKIFVVDRDPRDIYLLEKYVWHGHTVPYYNIELFCKWFLWTRRQYENSTKGNSIKIQFEDLVYKYEETVKKIEEYIGLDETKHLHLKKKFNPDISKKNTRLWEKYSGEKENIEYIYRKLNQYCYKNYLA